MNKVSSTTHKSFSQQVAFGTCIAFTITAALAGIALVAVQFIRVKSMGHITALGNLNNGLLNIICGSTLGGSLIITVASGYAHFKIERKRARETTRIAQEGLQDDNEEFLDCVDSDDDSPETMRIAPGSPPGDEADDEEFLECENSDDDSPETMGIAPGSPPGDEEFLDCVDSDDDSRILTLDLLDPSTTSQPYENHDDFDSSLRETVASKPLNTETLTELLKQGCDVDDVQKLYLENFLNPRINALENFLKHYLNLYKKIKPSDSRDYFHLLKTSIEKLRVVFLEKALKRKNALEAFLESSQSSEEDLLEQVAGLLSTEKSPILNTFLIGSELENSRTNEFLHDLMLVIKERASTDDSAVSLGELPAFFNTPEDATSQPEIFHFLSSEKNWGLSGDERYTKIKTEDELRTAIKKALDQYPKQAYSYLADQLIEESKILERAIFIPVSMVSFLCKFRKWSIAEANKSIGFANQLSWVLHGEGTLFQKALDLISDNHKKNLFIQSAKDQILKTSSEKTKKSLYEEMKLVCPQYLDTPIHEAFETLFESIVVPVSYFLYGKVKFKLDKKFQEMTLNHLTEEQKQQVFGSTDNAFILDANGIDAGGLEHHNLCYFENAYTLSETNELSEVCCKVVLDPSNKNVTPYELTKKLTIALSS